MEIISSSWEQVDWHQHRNKLQSADKHLEHFQLQSINWVHKYFESTSAHFNGRSVNPCLFECWAKLDWGLFQKQWTTILFFVLIFGCSISYRFIIWINAHASLLASTYESYNRSPKVEVYRYLVFYMCSTHLVEAFLSEGWPIALLQIAWAPRVNKHLMLDKQATRAAIWSSSQLYIINNLMETFSISASDGDRISPCSSRMASMYPQRSGSVRSRPSSKPAIN